MNKLKGKKELFAGRHFDREVIILLAWVMWSRGWPSADFILPIPRSCAGYSGTCRSSRNAGRVTHAKAAAPGASMRHT